MRNAHSRRSERGYAMAALLVAMSVMTIVLSTAMPVYQTVARREREAELVFRGEQYARAIALFQRKYGNALPPDVDVLIDQRFLRKKYKDPITGGDFLFLGPASPELAQALGTTPQPWLRSVEDEYDDVSPRHRWNVKMSMASAGAKLRGLYRGRFRGIKVVTRGASPRVVEADVIGKAGRTRVSGARRDDG